MRRSEWGRCSVQVGAGSLRQASGSSHLRLVFDPAGLIIRGREEPASAPAPRSQALTFEQHVVPILAKTACPATVLRRTRRVVESAHACFTFQKGERAASRSSWLERPVRAAHPAHFGWHDAAQGQAAIGRIGCSDLEIMDRIHRDMPRTSKRSLTDPESSAPGS